MKMKVLEGHVSPETAFHVADYPYGFRLRCQIRYWLEDHPKRGVRFVSQTTNPKQGDKWNKPKATTYADIAGAMFLDDKDHVCWTGLSFYSDAAEARAFLDKYGVGLPPYALTRLAAWIVRKERYEENSDHLG
jgi:hypothetical protein